MISYGRNIQTFLQVFIALYIVIVTAIYSQSLTKTFIGNRGRKRFILYNVYVMLRHLDVLCIISCVEKLVRHLGYVIGIMLLASLYILYVINDISKIFKLLKEDKHDTYCIDRIVRTFAFRRRFNILSALGYLSVYDGYKVQYFIISLKDVRELTKLCNNQIIFGVIHYYRASGRIYGIEAVRHGIERS